MLDEDMAHGAFHCSPSLYIHWSLVYIHCTGDTILSIYTTFCIDAYLISPTQKTNHVPRLNSDVDPCFSLSLSLSLFNQEEEEERRQTAKSGETPWSPP